MFAALAKTAGIVNLVVLAGVAIFLAEAFPALIAPAAELPGGRSLIAYIAPLAFGTISRPGSRWSSRLRWR